MFTKSKLLLSWWKRCGLALGGVGAAMVLCELLLRLFVCFRAASVRPLLSGTVASTVIERADPIRNHALVEGANFISTGSPPGLEFCVYGSINEQGLNDETVPLQKPREEVRILVLGDSFVEARQVRRKDNFCKLLEGRMRGRLNRPVRVINAGVSSYSPLLCYLFFCRELAKYKPDLVIFAFFANDVFDDIRYTHKAKFGEDGLPVAVAPGAPWPVFRRTGDGDAEKSAKLQATMRQWLNAPGSWWTSHFYVAAIADRATEARKLKAVSKDQPPNDEFFILENDSELAPLQKYGWQLSQKYLGYLKSACDTNGARLLLTSVPICSQVTGQSSYDHFFFSGKPNNANHTNVEAMAMALKIPYVDLFSPLRKTRTGLYFPHDGHWTRKGHAVVAEALEGSVVRSVAPVK